MLADKQPRPFDSAASPTAATSSPAHHDGHQQKQHRDQEEDNHHDHHQRASIPAHDMAGIMELAQKAAPASDECGIRLLTQKVIMAREKRKARRAQLREQSTATALRLGAKKRARQARDEEAMSIVALARFVGRMAEGRGIKMNDMRSRQRTTGFASLLGAPSRRSDSPSDLRRSYSTSSFSSSSSSNHSRSSSSSTRPSKIVAVAQYPRLPIQRPLHTLPLIRDLKSSSMLRYIAPVSRIALSLVPALRILASYLGGSASAKARFVTNLSGALIVIPMAILVALWTAGLELTPLTGRLRAIYLNSNEEADLVHALLAVGKPAETNLDANGRETDWEQVLRFILGSEGGRTEHEQELLLGGRVIDRAVDWRVYWVESTLARLEDAMFDNATSSEEDLELHHAIPFQLVPTEAQPLVPRGEMPSVSWQDACQKPAKMIGRSQRYSVILIDRPEKNAFSFGFGPRAFAKQGMKGSELRNEGVIVVFSGFLDDILGRDAYSMRPVEGRVHASNEGPSAAQTSWLAVLLAHELGHLVLDHTLEHYAGYPAIVPHLERLAGDVLRTALFPLTAVLGPFVSDAFARLVHQSASHDIADANSLTRLAGGCQSRTMELEADVVGLRLLANAGFDPYRALSFWEDRLNDRGIASSEVHHHHHSVARMLHHSGPGGDWVADSEAALSERELELVRTHPVDEVRVGRIRQELDKWEEEGLRLWATAR